MNEEQMTDLHKGQQKARLMALHLQERKIEIR